MSLFATKNLYFFLTLLTFPNPKLVTESLKFTKLKAITNTLIIKRTAELADLRIYQHELGVLRKYFKVFMSSQYL